MEEILKNISVNDLEKLKLLLSIIPGHERKEVVTLRVFRDEYLNYIKSNRSFSYYKSSNIAFNHFIDFFSQKNGKPGLQYSIHSLQQKDFENFLSYLQLKVRRGYVVYYRNLKAAFNKAKDWGYVKENYFTKVKLPKRQKMAPVFINSDQLEVISRQLAIGNSGNKNEIVKDVVLFAFHTGMRLDEIVNLRWKNVDLQNGVITVGDEEFTTKGRKQRYIPICDEAREAIENCELRMQNEKKNIHVIKLVGDKSAFSSTALRLRSEQDSELRLRVTNEFVFSKSDGKKFTGDYFSRRFKRACRNAGIDKSIHFHSLRHSFASNLVQKGVSLYTVKELLGHASISTTEIYSHLNMESLREAVEKLDTRSEMLDTRQKQKQNLEENSRLQIFSINSGEMK